MLRRRILLSQRQARRPIALPTRRSISTADGDAQSPRDSPTPPRRAPIDVSALLSQPSWSIAALMPPPQTPQDSPITPAQLRHLLRLSALPEPKDDAEEAAMLRTLAAQLHFVRQIQAVDAAGVEPLRAIRDESALAEKEREVTLEKMAGALGREEVVGKHVKRIRRKPENKEGVVVEDSPKGWKPLDTAKRRVGQYFVVDTGKGEEGGS